MSQSFAQTGTLITASLLLLGLLNHESDAQEKCDGRAQTYDFGGVSFVTTSRVFKGSGVDLYVTCVENHSNKDLWINWFVPGPISYVLPGRIVESPRAFLTEENVEYKGCLEYGSVGEYIQVPFIGHAADAPRIDNEKAGCDKVNPRAVNSSSSPSATPTEVPVKVYFPSDAKEASTTMLLLEGVARTGINGDVLSTVVAYSITHASKEQRGRPEDMRMRPFVSDGFFDKDYVETFYKKYSKNGIALKGGDEISLSVYDVKSAKTFTLTSVRYGIFDREDRLVAAFFAPFWGPTP